MEVTSILTIRKNVEEPEKATILLGSIREGGGHKTQHCPQDRRDR